MTKFSAVDDTMTDIAALRAALLAGAHPIALERDLDAIPAALVPKDMTVESLEHLLPQPARKRATFQTNSLDDFLTYCANNVPDEVGEDNRATGNAHIFYNDTPPRAEAILDFGSPEAPAWSEHRAVWTPRESPALQALRALLGKALSQDTLTDYIDDWADYLSFERADGTAVIVAAARAAIADMTAETVKAMRSKIGDFERERSALEKLSVGPYIPARMVLTCAPWTGFSTHQLQVRLAAAEGAGTLALRLAIIGWPLHQETLLEELRDRLEARPTPITVLSGTV
jgi:uncharacterized protein YfdQ (DUF2303 family)